MSSLNKIEYINIRYLLNSISHSNILNYESQEEIKEALGLFNLSNKSLVVLDINRVRFNTIEFNPESPKKSVLYNVFNDLLSKSEIDFIFVNGGEEASLHIIEKDFLKKENVFVLTFIPNYYFIHSKTVNNPDSHELEKRWNFLESIDFIKSMKNCQAFLEKLISQKIKGLLLKNKCIQNIEIKDHILSSTPVHVNKYINIKPLIENYRTFDEICFFLTDRIIEKFGTPHFLIAPSKNALSLASGILRYLKTSDIIFVNQVSPITAFNNYSNIDAIIPTGRYAIIEDFHCMGTEIKVIKGILWSHGVNYQDNVYSFPVASTRIYDNDYPGGALGQNIYPLYKLENELNYKMFTNNSCPVCNEINGCEHRKLFNF